MMIHENYKKQVYDEKLNRFRDITELEELERDLSFLLQDRTDNTCNIKEVKDQIKEFKEKLKDLLTLFILSLLVNILYFPFFFFKFKA